MMTDNDHLDRLLGEDEVRVIPFSLDDDVMMPLDLGLSWLSEAERDRASSFHFENHGDRFVRGRAMVRKILAAHLGKSPGDLEFEIGQRGKPDLVCRGLYFNLSHSLDRAVLAISRIPSIGIDIECFSREVDIDGLSRRCYRDVEIARYEGMTEKQKIRAFFWTWTAKEARMKATGEGFGLEPLKIEVEFTDQLPHAYVEPRNPAAYIKPVLIDDDEGVACSVASTSPFRVVLI